MNKYVFTLNTAVLLLIEVAPCQTLHRPVSSIYTGVGTYSTKQADVFSFTYNQAALAGVKYSSAGIYSERRFNLAATSMFTAAVAIPSKMGNVGVSLSYSGFKDFNEKGVGLAYARNLGAKVDIGVQFNYVGFQVPSYSAANTINFEIGAMVHLTERLNLGLHAYNPAGGKFGKTGEQLTASYIAGLGYDASESFFVSAALIKEQSYPVHVNAGIQYRFAERFFLRAAVSSASSMGYAGAGITWNKFRLDLCGSFHPQLGMSPGLLLIMNFGAPSIPLTSGYDNENLLPETSPQ